MTTEREKMLRGDPYDPFDPRLVEERSRARSLTRWYNDTEETETETRAALLAELFGTVGENAFVEPPFRCDYGSQIHVGDEFFANFGCVMLDVCEIRFGSHCLLGPGVHVYTATHPLDAETRREGVEFGDPVTVGDDVWVGGQAVLNPGVSVGDRAVVASGAVVTGDVPSDVVVGGNPARVLKELDDQ
ncbi:MULTISPECIES: sugar O-acetyltransferase [Haloprofundus]|uniref:sugar O-acetyltransferase n=1 Tax=Haloprofundus TaxID=1911573 RepID=UPI000E433FD9|nr:MULTISPECIES: sugar O-acetyltransferase [Haloprofundus]QCJ48288.1 sugar O-acetyltransferase [Haloprofundus sp. MHR1]